MKLIVKTDNKNIWIIALVLVVGAVFFFGNGDRVTGQQTFGAAPDPGGSAFIRAHSCDADGTCEMRNAAVSNLITSRNVTTSSLLARDDIIFFGDLSPQGRDCAFGAILKKSGGSGRWICANRPNCYSATGNGTWQAFASCGSSATLTGGGATCYDGSEVESSAPTGNAWMAQCNDRSGNVTAWARCCTF